MEIEIIVLIVTAVGTLAGIIGTYYTARTSKKKKLNEEILKPIPITDYPDLWKKNFPIEQGKETEIKPPELITDNVFKSVPDVKTWRNVFVHASGSSSENEIEKKVSDKITEIKNRVEEIEKRFPRKSTIEKVASVNDAILATNFESLSETAKRIAAGAAFLTILAAPLAAEDIEVEVNVDDMKQNPVENVLVTAEKDGQVQDSTRTDENGYGVLHLTTVGIDDEDQFRPLEYSLSQNHPNPWNPSTTIKFSTLDKGFFVIYNLLGQKIAEEEIPGAGHYTANWGGINDQGKRMGEGIYFYSIITPKHRETKKMTLLGSGRGGMLSVKGTQENVSPQETDQMPPGVVRKTDMYLLSFELDEITNIDTLVNISQDTTIDVNVNRGPYLETDVPDTNIATGDTLLFNFDENFYNDNTTLFDLLEFTANDTGIYALQVTAIDSIDTSLTALSNEFHITVYQPNQPPEQVADIEDQTIQEDNQLELLVSDYVEDPDNDPLYVTSVNLPEEWWTATNDTVTFTPPQDWNGTQEGIEINVSDGEYGITLNQWNLMVLAVNDAPTIDIPDQSIAEDTSLVTLINLSDYSSDVEGDSLTYAIINQTNPELVNLIINNNYMLLDSLQSNSSGLSVVGVSASDGSLADTSYFTLTIEPRADLTLKHVHFKTNELIPGSDFTINSTNYAGVDSVELQLNPGQATIDVYHDDYWQYYFWVSEEESEENIGQKDRSNPSLLDIGTDDKSYWVHSIHDTVDMANIEIMIDTDYPEGLDRFDTDTVTVWVAPGYDIADSSTLSWLEEVALSDYKDGIRYISNYSFGTKFQLYGSAPSTSYIKVRFIEGTPHPGSHNEIVNFETNVIEWAELRFDTDVYKSDIMAEIRQTLHARTDSPPNWVWAEHDSTGNIIYSVKMADLGLIAYSFNPGTDFYQQTTNSNNKGNNDNNGQYNLESTTTTPMPKFEGWKEGE